MLLCLLWVSRGQYEEKLILNITVFVVRVWGWQCIQELILNVTVFGESVWGWQCRQELIVIVTVLVMSVERAI